MSTAKKKTCKIENRWAEKMSVEVKVDEMCCRWILVHDEHDDVCAGDEFNDCENGMMATQIISNDFALQIRIGHTRTSFQSHFSAHRKPNGRHILDTVERVDAAVPFCQSQPPENVLQPLTILSTCQALQSAANNKSTWYLIYEIYFSHSTIHSFECGKCAQPVFSQVSKRACTTYQRRHSSNFIRCLMTSELLNNGLSQSIFSASLWLTNESWQIEQQTIVLFHCILNQFLWRANLI